jgi:hypothetical protein
MRIAKKATYLYALGSAMAMVNGHGHVRQHSMNGETYIGYLPYNKPDFTADAPSIGSTLLVGLSWKC